MAWNDPSELHVGLTGQIYVAPLGAALPTTTTGALNAAFVGLGYTTEDGFTFNVGRDTTDIPAWQSLDPIRTIIAARNVSIGFSLQQWNEDTVPLAFGGGSISGSTPNFRYNLPDPEAGLDERAMVIDSQDGSNNMRFVVARGIVADAVEAQFNHGGTAVLPISFKALKPETGSIVTVYSNMAAFTAGS